VCHPGYGFTDDSFDFSDPTRIDCLVCHDTTGTYQKRLGGMPDRKVDLVHVAENVGHTSRQTCGSCHFSGGGGDAVKHADLSRTLNRPDRRCDIHMGGYDFRCTECHETRNHRIPGRSSSVAVVEGVKDCEACHTKAPHYGDDLLDHHLNKHCEAVACNTCHSPVYSKCKPTKVFWDWSKAGDTGRKPKTDPYGEVDYSWKKGEFRWKEAAKPAYAWHNGYWKRILLGDKVDLGRVNHITDPVGSIRDPLAKIYPFKVMRGVQPADAAYRYLLIPHLFGADGYWETLEWQKAFRIGMKAAGLPYSGRYKWVRTHMHWAVKHEVMPKEYALSCVQCHESLTGERTCDRCHQRSRKVDFRKLVQQGTDFKAMFERGRDVKALIGTTDYIGFRDLGYEGDPIVTGGRFKKLPLGTGENAER
jgi:octaheme c-type cytochrome (tetrathionate reductase family)